MIIVGVIAAVVIVIGLILLNYVTSQSPSTPITVSSRDWGKPDAPVTIEEYGDFQ